MSETVILDPTEVATAGRVELDLTSEEISPTAASGVDWGDAAIEMYLADLDRGSIPVDYRVPNRTVTIPLIVRATAIYTLDQARVRLQQKVSLIQREGGWLKRVTAGGTTVYLDLVNASLKLGGNWLQAHRDIDPEATLTLEALPEFYEGEIELASHSETTKPELTWTETGIRGDTPGRVRIVATNGSAENQQGLLLGIRSRNYDSATTAALAYEAEAMTAMDTATATALSGASGSSNNTIKHAALSGSWWTPVVKTDLTSGGRLTHAGRYRVFARVYTTTGSSSVLPPKVRLTWGKGADAQISNDAFTIPSPGSFYVADLGTIECGLGDGWTGVIQGLASSSAGADVYVDRVWLWPVDESYAKLTAPQPASLGIGSFVARDDFASLADEADLNTRVAPLGGTWATSGDTGDFKGDTVAGDPVIYRATTGDTNGRLALLPGDWGGIELGMDFASSFWRSGIDIRLVCRYVADDGSGNPGWLALEAFNSSGYQALLLHVRYAAADYYIGAVATPGTPFATWTSLRVQVGTSGNVTAGLYAPNSPVKSYSLSGYHSALKTGGALDSGKAGIWDINTAATAATRYYANVYAVAADSDAVMFGSQSAELATTGMTREDSTGTAYYPIGEQVGSLPRLPVAGLEGRTTELIVKSSRGDFDQAPDSAIDDLSAQVYYRPSWLFVAD